MSYKDKLPQKWTERECAEWKMDVGKRLRIAVDSQYGDRKQYEFAKDVGISQGSLSEIINGISTPSSLTLLKIIENSDIDVIDILKG